MSQTFIKAVIFDCDGVLVDTEHLSHLAWQTKLADAGLHLTIAELQQHFTGFTTMANLNKAELLLGQALPEDFAGQVRNLFWQQINDHLPLMPGIEATLQHIQLPKAAATNALRRELNFKLEKSGLGRYFAHTICCEDVPYPKPAPDIYLEAARRLNVRPEYCAVIEDSIAGINAGVSAGMTVFGFSRDTDPNGMLAAGAFRCFQDMAGLPGLLGW